MKNMECAKCNGSAVGFKCDVCDEEMAEPNAAHRCGINHCLPKCAGCGKVQTQCDCL